MFFVRLFDLCLFGLFVSSSSWRLGRAAACNCGTSWTFLLPFFYIDLTVYQLQSSHIYLVYELRNVLAKLDLFCASVVSYVTFLPLLVPISASFGALKRLCFVTVPFSG